MFSTIFTKGNKFCDFLSVSLDEEALPKWGPQSQGQGKELLALKVLPLALEAFLEVQVIHR